MSETQPSRGFCRLVWTAMIAIPILTLLLIFVPWTLHYFALNERIASSRDELVRYQRLIASVPRLKQELQTVQQNETFKAFYFDAPTLALAGANLQSQVQKIVEAAGGRLISIQILPNDPGVKPARIQIRTQIQGTTASLIDLLFQVDQARPFLFVEQLSVRSSARPLPPARPGAPPRARAPQRNDDSYLTIRMDIYGFVLGGGA